MQRAEILSRSHCNEDTRYQSRGTPFASNVTVLRVKFSLPDSQKRGVLDHVTTLLADPSRLLFRLGRNIYEEKRPS